jgi:cytochrome c oxidase subunit II
MHHHDVNRVSHQGNRRTEIEPMQFQHHRTLGLGRAIVPFCHRLPPSRPIQRRSCRHRNPLRLAFQLGIAATLPACTGPLSTLDPSGPAGASIATLWWVMLAGSAILFLLVMTLFVLVIRRPGWGSSVSPERWLVLGGLVLPAVVLLPLIAYAMIAGERLLPLPGQAPARIEAVGRQWAWTFRYPDHGATETKGVLHMPAGAPVDILVSSQDVIHAFWIPRLAGKIDAVPGHVNRLRIQADQPGRYAGQCSEFCGLDHASMRFDVVVHRPEEFSAALARAAASEGSQKK